MQITRQFAEAETKTIAAANNDALIDEFDNISGQGKSSVQSSSEEKKKFERAVDIIHEIADIE
uniref:Uncharacterized protein n=1 Tax=Fusarium oxysporum (strain Fo5176) TaxID=660025 RepID=A0A0D2XBQ4_FUSOF